MDNKDDDDKYMLDTNTDCNPKISVITWVMLAWIVILCCAGLVFVGWVLWN